MIKVLEHGVRKITCYNCRAKLQYEQEDISEEIIPALLGEDEVRQYIICPDCGTKIVFNFKTMTEEQLILKIEELEKHQDEQEKHQDEQDKKIKQLEEKVKLASIGFPVNHFK